ncbi:MAG: prephenate dehydratase [Lentisphaeria bacterium]|nr:prephenate dehydratase [Lentisphaeria bacterium]
MNHEPVKVAIQGIEGSYHEEAAVTYFEHDVTIVPTLSFDEMFAALERRDAEYAAMAIENTVAGSILPNYALLRESGLRIVGETYLRIALNLLTFEPQTMADVVEVYSHPMAINQCRVFFREYPRIKLIHGPDTASAAKQVRDERRPGTAAIASAHAARLYGLKVLAEEIETNKANYTRFLILTDQLNTVSNRDADKASICFSLQHQVGCLSQVLSVLAFYGMNLTKIQSLPIIGREWQYLFYVDVAFSDFVRYRQALSAIRPLTDIFEVLGEYCQGLKALEQVNRQSFPDAGTAPGE